MGGRPRRVYSLTENKKLRVSVVGATGYTGAELLRILVHHPNVELSQITSRADAGKPIAESWPNFRDVDLVYSAPDVKQIAEHSDVVFFATPHTVAMSMVPALIEAGCTVIDLSADFRLQDIDEWERWYGETHTAPELAQQAVYGLPELNRKSMVGARLIACPGCYPTAIQLGLIPLLEAGLIEADSIIANAASGVSGAGRQAKVANLFAEVSDNFKAYGVAGHRHLPEILESLNRTTEQSVGMTFVPHLLPIIRGIHATLYCKPLGSLDDENWQSLFEQRYVDEPFVDVLPLGVYPETRSVKGTNKCRISVQPIASSDMLCVMSVEDNLTKGAAGQAVQAMNIAFELEETLGLHQLALLP